MCPSIPSTPRTDARSFSPMRARRSCSRIYRCQVRRLVNGSTAMNSEYVEIFIHLSVPSSFIFHTKTACHSLYPSISFTSMALLLSTPVVPFHSSQFLTRSILCICPLPHLTPSLSLSLAAPTSVCAAQVHRGARPARRVLGRGRVGETRAVCAAVRIGSGTVLPVWSRMMSFDKQHPASTNH